MKKAHKDAVGIFVFGSVDVHLSYYHNYGRKGLYEENVLEEYVKFVESIPMKDKIIFGVFPPTVADENVQKSLQKYGVDYPSNIPKYEFTYENRYNNYKKFNEKLMNICKKYGVRFSNVGDKLLKNDKIDSKSLPYNNLDIHVKWEPQISAALDELKNIYPADYRIKKHLLKFQKKPIQAWDDW